MQLSNPFAKATESYLSGVTSTMLGFAVAVVLLRGTSLAEPAGQEARPFDLVVVGATPGGVACAVRGAREGLSVLLVHHTKHLGGILANGLGVWDTLYEGHRSPIYDELRWGIFDYYKTTYGEDSPQYRDAVPAKSGHTNGKFEPKVAEQLITQMVDSEPRITVLQGWHVVAARREGTNIVALTFGKMVGPDERTVRGRVFADCTYEGDLMAAAEVPYRVGRESRDEFGELHAGRIFLRPTKSPPARLDPKALAEHARLNLRKFSGYQEIVCPASTGEADENVQAFNYRTVLSSDPENRTLPARPEPYDPEALRQLESGSIVRPLPNNKIGWNRPQLVGPHNAYVEGDWTVRQRVMNQHWQATMGLLWFLQNDPSVPEKTRQYWRPYGLAKDEFLDNGHRPHEIYVREARRLKGRQVFTEHDLSPTAGLMHSPIYGDSIAITDWYMDSHACTLERAGGSIDEGKMMLHQETWPGQISYQCLVADGTDNLLVPVCLSATHVAWGAVRLEPLWVETGEAAGLAAAMAVEADTTPLAIDVDRLVRTLAKRRFLISFFNDVDVSGAESWIPAVQYFGTQGFFANYDAQPDDPLDEATARLWADGFAARNAGTLAPTALACKVAKAEAAGKAITAEGFVRLLPDGSERHLAECSIAADEPITRADACRLMFAMLD